MSQAISLWGANYSDVPAVDLPKTGGGTASFTDVTDTTAAASDVAQGKYFYTAQGVRTQGTSSGGTGGVTQDANGYLVLSDQGGGGGSVTITPLNVTQNGTYTAPTGTAYSPVSVNVSGGTSSWTLVAQSEFTANITNTGTATITGADVEFSLSDVTNSQMWYVRVRDKAGKRNGYFYGSDSFFFWTDVSSGIGSVGIRACLACGSSGTMTVQTSNGGTVYGFEGYGIYLSGNGHDVPYLQMGGRYNSSMTGTINGTFKIELYKLAWPDNISPFS